MALLPALCDALAEWKRCFCDRRTLRCAQAHALALLVSLGRRTLSRSICVLGRQWRNWTADYRFFSQCLWHPQALFDVVLEGLRGVLSPTQPLLVALDDTPWRKTGKRIRAARILRDPISPPFHTNLCRALRFLQAVVLVWPREAAEAPRAIPLAFALAPPVAKPKRPRKPGQRASKSDWAAYARAWRAHRKNLKNYRQRQQNSHLSRGPNLRERRSLSASQAAEPQVIADGDKCNLNRPERRSPQGPALFGPTYLVAA
jgi:hypothetical protein